jgi:hypothetical protein
MAKKYWISLPLIAVENATDAAVAAFTKGGPKKELEVEVAAVIMKWLMDRNVPFTIDFDSATVDRTAAFEALPRRLQKALGYKAPVASENAAEEAQPQEPGVGAPEGSVAGVEQTGEQADQTSVPETGEEEAADSGKAYADDTPVAE